MRSSAGWVVVCVSGLVGCGPGGDDTGNDDTGDGDTVTWSYDALPGAKDPVFAAVQFDEGTWQEVTLVDGAVDLAPPAAGASYRAVTVCEGPFGLDVELVISNLTTLPEPPLGCQWPDPDRTVTVSGVVQNTSLATVYAGGGEDFSSPSETYDIDVLPGNYDLVASEIAATPRMAVRANVAVSSDTTADLDYAADLVTPDEASVTITGASYTEAWGVTERGTAFLAGSGGTIRTPPASSGIVVHRVFVQANSANGVEIMAVGPGADVVDTMPALEPFDFDVAVDGDDGFTVGLDPVAPNGADGLVVVNTTRVQTTPTYVETPVKILATYDEINDTSGFFVAGDVWGLEDFPAGALNGDFDLVHTTASRTSVVEVSDLVFAMYLAQIGLSLDGKGAQGVVDARESFLAAFQTGRIAANP